jgi:hypothetical protein
MHGTSNIKIINNVTGLKRKSNHMPSLFKTDDKGVLLEKAA